jgi:hypothetical protein
MNWKLLIVLVSMLGLGSSWAQDSRTLLRDGLFAEESEGDLTTAAAKYEALVKRYGEERKLAAVALYRLAEVRRRQDRKEDAVKLYEKLLLEFVGVEPQGKMAKENLLALGGKMPAVLSGVMDDEEMELVRLKKLALTSPDVVASGNSVQKAIKQSWYRVLGYYLENGYDSNQDGILRYAAGDGNLEACRQLVEAGADPNLEENRESLRTAIEQGFAKITDYLIEKGAKVEVCVPDCIKLVIERKGSLEEIQRFVELGFRWTNFGLSLRSIGRSGIERFGIPLLRSGRE